MWVVIMLSCLIFQSHFRARPSDDFTDGGIAAFPSGDMAVPARFVRFCMLYDMRRYAGGRLREVSKMRCVNLSLKFENVNCLLRTFQER